MSFEIVATWKQTSAELEAEVAEFWLANKAILEEQEARERAREVVCVARSEQGAIVGLATAYACIAPALRQPMYYYRIYLAAGSRGRGLAIPLVLKSQEVLQQFNLALPKPLCLGILLEVENEKLSAVLNQARWPTMDFTFIGYSRRGFPLRVWYFKDARLFAPSPLK